MNSDKNFKGFRMRGIEARDVCQFYLTRLWVTGSSRY